MLPVFHLVPLVGQCRILNLTKLLVLTSPEGYFSDLSSLGSSGHAGTRGVSGQSEGLQLPLWVGRPLEWVCRVTWALLLLTTEPTTVAGRSLLTSFPDGGGVTRA